MKYDWEHFSTPNRAGFLRLGKTEQGFEILYGANPVYGLGPGNVRWDPFVQVEFDGTNIPPLKEVHKYQVTVRKQDFPKALDDAIVGLKLYLRDAGIRYKS